eukprot:TRINITY_DN37192_c0_g1_i1.p1 TRINITY_DN37192_c0_g1~~TRINITY_DN37192_c0_g1_i1.p1  ORF type:complete len:1320 (+),score=265.34 TRINITY_DN37192_c0_g1_i1:269-3961(+)
MFGGLPPPSAPSAASAPSVGGGGVADADSPSDAAARAPGAPTSLGAPTAGLGRGELAEAAAEAVAAAEARDLERLTRSSGRLESAVASLAIAGDESAWAAFECCLTLEAHSQLRLVNLGWRLLKQLAAASPATAPAAARLSAKRLTALWEGLLASLRLPASADGASSGEGLASSREEWRRKVALATFHCQCFAKVISHCTHAQVDEACRGLPLHQVETGICAAVTSGGRLEWAAELRTEMVRSLVPALRRHLQISEQPRAAMDLFLSWHDQKSDFSSGAFVCASLLALRSVEFGESSSHLLEAALSQVEFLLSSGHALDELFYSTLCPPIDECLSSFAPPHLLRWAVGHSFRLRQLSLRCLGRAKATVQSEYAISLARLGLAATEVVSSGQRHALAALAVIVAASPRPAELLREALEPLPERPNPEHFAAFCRCVELQRAREALAEWAQAVAAAREPGDAVALATLLPSNAPQRAELAKCLQELLGKSAKGAAPRWAGLYALYASTARAKALDSGEETAVRTLARYAVSMCSRPLAVEICTAMGAQPGLLLSHAPDMLSKVHAALLDTGTDERSKGKSSWVRDVAAGWALQKLGSHEMPSSRLRADEERGASDTAREFRLALSSVEASLGNVASPLELGELLGRVRKSVDSYASALRNAPSAWSEELCSLYTHRVALEARASGESESKPLAEQKSTLLAKLVAVLLSASEVWTCGDVFNDLNVLREEAEVALCAVLAQLCAMHLEEGRGQSSDNLAAVMQRDLLGMERSLRAGINMEVERQNQQKRSMNESFASDPSRVRHPASDSAGRRVSRPLTDAPVSSPPPRETQLPPPETIDVTVNNDECPPRRKTEFRTVADMAGVKRPAEKPLAGAPKRSSASIVDICHDVVKGKNAASGEKREWPEEWLAAADAELLERLVPMLEGTISLPEGVGRVARDDIAGLAKAKEAIWEMLILPRRCPELFRSTLTRPPRGVLLFGPPGTGKTMLARWIATESEATFFNISGSTVFSKWMGEAEKTVKVLFLLAQQRAPSVIFLDEVDALLSARGDKDSEGSRRVKNELLQALDGLAVGSEDLLVVGATNLPWEIDAAASRRFAKKLHIPLPGAEARREHLVRCVERHHEEWGLGRVGLEADALEWLVARLDGFSMSDLRDLLREAALVPAREAYRSLQGSPAGATLQKRPLLRSDFEAALTQVFPGVSVADAERFRCYNEQHGVVRGAEAMRDGGG